MITRRPFVSTSAYAKAGLSASATFEGTVQGVVVQARKARPSGSGSPSPVRSGARKKSDGSSTSR